LDAEVKNTHFIFILGGQPHPFRALHYYTGIDWHHWQPCSRFPGSGLFCI